MNKNIIKFSVVLISLFFAACNFSSTEKKDTADTNLIKSRYTHLLNYPVDSTAYPRSLKANGTIKKVVSDDWTSGFFPGNLWYIFELTNDEKYKEKALEWTSFSEKEKDNAHSHDVGFKVNCSVGNAYRLTKTEAYKKVIIEAANTLKNRFNTTVGATRSWDFNKEEWEYPVIIDNMMNLELLFEATVISKDSSYYKVADKHAQTTLTNHFRDDNSTYHVVVYDTITGKPIKKITHQGYNDSSSWTRGQAWAVYGFTMAYRYTKNKAYLDQAEATALFFINHKNLPKDGIPYWDFNDPDIPNTARDVSAATIMASALLEFGTYKENDRLLTYAEKVLKTLNSKEYILSKDVSAPFIFKHSTGNKPANSEIDEPIVYADYYYLEALLRKNARKK